MIEIDTNEYRKQLKQEVIDSGHYFRLEVLVPSVGAKEMLLGSRPLVEQEECHCSLATTVMGLLTLDLIKESLLKDKDVKEVYKDFKGHMKSRKIIIPDKIIEEDE